ncbi:diuretic hormone receptor [Nephila pilipes]|uniref:Diuretic hormone receptor n=1 Tax=Nephila pilipes TaxID=299642 RepID=A0A8X6IWL3_NEPPI|nr:diuretic hormone receptor [Nephila pilipes]
MLKRYPFTVKSLYDFCNTTWDGLSCWPPTKAGTTVIIKCMEFLNRVPYDTTQNATRECHANGTWAPRSDYSECRPLDQKDESFENLWDIKDAHTIYSIGYGLSLIALVIALWIFLYFSDLRCLRNTIHTNLLVTYLFIDLTWIITAALQTSTSHEANKVACFLFIMLTYLMGTNFFWMFVEGLYLYILVVKTFSVETVKMHVYAAIGWGLPAAMIIPWAIVKSQFSHVERNDQHTKVFAVHGCPWQNKDHFDYIFICPVILVLMINIYFLGRIMWVLITKLRAATSVESKQYRKAAKALLVLIPLLGVTYIVVIVTPAHRTARVVFAYAQALLLSTQGFTVAVLYCFMNGEVQKSVRHHFEQWKDQRGLGSGRHPLRCDGSSNADGFRLYPNRGVRDRTSCISLSTSGTWLSTYKSPQSTVQRPSNGSYSPVPMKEETI